MILKNTSVVKEALPSPATGSQINRSQSLLGTTARIPVLAPSRGDRARLEALLSDVWTRDVLPFPGITARSRSEHLVRASASSVMRKLSVVSIASSFSKRSASLASLQQKVSTDEEASSSSSWARYTSPATTASAEMMEDASRSQLSVIPDEVERLSPSLRRVEMGYALDVAEVVERMEEIEDKGVPSFAPSLLQPTTNISRPGSAQTSGFKSLREEKENVALPPARDAGKTALRSRKLSNKWASKVGVLHRETVVQSIRNMFR